MRDMLFLSCSSVLLLVFLSFRSSTFILLGSVCYSAQLFSVSTTISKKVYSNHRAISSPFFLSRHSSPSNAVLLPGTLSRADFSLLCWL
jgi:hypothetical protein